MLMTMITLIEVSMLLISSFYFDMKYLMNLKEANFCENLFLDNKFFNTLN